MVHSTLRILPCNAIMVVMYSCIALGQTDTDSPGIVS